MNDHLVVGRRDGDRRGGDRGTGGGRRGGGEQGWGMTGRGLWGRPRRLPGWLGRLLLVRLLQLRTLLEGWLEKTTSVSFHNFFVLFLILFSLGFDGIKYFRVTMAVVKA